MLYWWTEKFSWGWWIWIFAFSILIFLVIHGRLADGRIKSTAFWMLIEGCFVCMSTASAICSLLNLDSMYSIFVWSIKVCSIGFRSWTEIKWSKIALLFLCDCSLHFSVVDVLPMYDWVPLQWPCWHLKFCFKIYQWKQW